MHGPGLDTNQAQPRHLISASRGPINVFLAFAIAPLVILALIAPLKLVMPIMSLLAFTAAAVLALVARRARPDLSIAGMRPAEAAALLGLMWIVTAALSNPSNVLRAFGG